MRIAVLILFQGYIVASSQIDTLQEIICVTRPHGKECYSKEFKPTYKWQEVKEGQQVPPGLHIKLNMDPSNGQPLRQAKLISEDDEVTGDHAVLQNNLSVPPNSEVLDIDSGRILQDELRAKVEAFKKSRIYGQPMDSLKINLQFRDIISKIQEASSISAKIELLESLDELSHGLEEGEILTSNPETFYTLLNVSQALPDSVVERVYRIMGSSLRNNHVAVSNTIKNFDSSFFESLFDELKRMTRSDIIQKRVLGVIQALLQSDHFVYTYFDKHDKLHSYGIDTLVVSYDFLGNQSKIRMIHILETLGFISQFTEETVETVAVANEQFLKFLQAWLSNDFISDPIRVHIYLEGLVSLHNANDDLQVEYSFLQWLSKQSENIFGPERRHTSDPHQLALDNLIHEVRHDVFGNKLATRKLLRDEL